MATTYTRADYTPSVAAGADHCTRGRLRSNIAAFKELLNEEAS